MLTPQQRLATPSNDIHEAIYQYARQHRGCMPGIITDVDTSPNVLGVTVNVRPALTEPVVVNGVRQDVEINKGTIPMVKLAVFGAGGFSITFPVSVGDECLLLFQDMCLDAAWQNGGYANPQLDKRRHDLSDAICIPLSWTQPSALDNYSGDSLQIRSEDGQTVIDIIDGQITIMAGTKVQILSPAISMGPSGGTPTALCTAAFYNWVLTDLYPWAVGLGYAGPAPPTTSITTDVKGS